MPRAALRTLSIQHGTLPLAGLDTASSEDVLPRDGRSRLVQNALLDRRGKVRSRGGVAGALAIPVLRSDSGFWPSPTATGSLVNMLFAKDASTLQTATVQTPWGPSTALNASFAIPATLVSATRLTPDYAVLNGFTYGFADGKFTRWDGTTATAGVVGYTNAPSSDTTFGGAIAVYLSRVFAGGVTPPGAALSSTDRVTLTWSDVDGPTTDTLAKWQDDVSGLTNKIILDDRSDTIQALVPWNGRLYILRDRSIWALIGTSPANWSTRKVADVGTQIRTTKTQPLAVACADALYFCNYEGLFRFDGSATHKVSGPVDDILNQFPSGNPIGVLPLTATKLLVNCFDTVGQLIYDTEAGCWSGLTSDALALIPGVTDAVEPIAMVMAGVTSCLIVSRTAGSGLLVGLDTVQNSSYGSDPTNVAGTTKAGIPVHVQSAPLPLATPEQVASLHKVTVDYYLSGRSALAAPSLVITLFAEDGSTIWTVTEPGQVNPASTRQNKTYDVFAEVSGKVTLDFRITYTGSDATLSAIGKFELLDASIQFQPAQDR